MIIGVPKEIKNNENRIAVIPSGVDELVGSGHEVLIERNAGAGSGISDEEYIQAGARIVEDRHELFSCAQIIVKVKEPLESEYDLFQEGQTLFTYLHLAANQPLVKILTDKKITGIAYETVKDEKGSLPLLLPMSEVAGRMSVQIGASLLQKFYGGSGVLLGGVPGVARADVVIIGGGIVGLNAAKMAVGLGANVTVLDIDKNRLSFLDDLFNGRIHTRISNPYCIAEMTAKADLLIGAVLLPGAKAPKLVTEKMVESMKEGSVIIDVAIDQGGIVETMDRITTHEDPFFIKHGVLHYSVSNIPGAVPRTSTYALTSVTFPYLKQLADKGPEKAMKENQSLISGLNTYDGKVTNEAVAQSVGMPYTPIET
jgi:alanine dehydrogenase